MCYVTELSIFVTFSCCGCEYRVEEDEERNVHNTEKKSEKIVLVLVRKVKKMEQWTDEDVSSGLYGS
jgi:hypothetical protein